MNSYFIDTFELTAYIPFSYIEANLKGRYGCRPIYKKTKKGKDKFIGYYYPASLNNNSEGIEMITKKCSKGEYYNQGENYKIRLKITTRKVPKFKDNIEEITDINEFFKMLGYVEDFIKHRLPDMTINNFKLTRIDVTKDIHGIPEPMIQEYIMLMRRTLIAGAYDHNKRLEENTKKFRQEDSFNALKKNGSSSIVEFVVYNNARAAIDQKMSEIEKEHYKDTMRMEIRCYRKYITEYIKSIGFDKDLSTIELLMLIFKCKADIAEKTFPKVFSMYYDCTFLNHYWLEKHIKKELQGKPKHMDNMLALERILNRKRTPDLSEAFELFNSKYKMFDKTKEKYTELGISPLTIRNKEYPFIQSIASVLEFEEPTDTDIRLFKKLYKKTRQKTLLLHTESGKYDNYPEVKADE